MTCTTFEKLAEDIEYEGFDYALVHYDDYSGIPDSDFQEAYKNFINAREKLVDVLNSKGIDAEN